MAEISMADGQVLRTKLNNFNANKIEGDNIAARLATLKAKHDAEKAGLTLQADIDAYNSYWTSLIQQLKTAAGL